MNKNKAKEILKSRIIDDPIWGSPEIAEAYKMAYYALFPEPDCKTGMIRCGCGSFPEWAERESEETGLMQHRLYCPKSQLTTRWHYSICETLDDWNTAMGWELE